MDSSTKGGGYHLLEYLNILTCRYRRPRMYAHEAQNHRAERSRYSEEDRRSVRRWEARECNQTENYYLSQRCMMVHTPVILNQGKTWECAWFAILTALVRMNPSIDYRKISRELIEEDGNSFTFQRAYKWFIKKWYIKDVQECTYSPFVLKKQPIICRLNSVDWATTGKPPYMLSFSNVQRMAWHYVCIDGPGRIANSYGDKWGDRWYFYFTQSQLRDIRRKSEFYKIILWDSTIQKPTK